MNCKLILSMLCCASLTLFSAEQTKWHVHTLSHHANHLKETESEFHKFMNKKQKQCDTTRTLKDGRTVFIGYLGSSNFKTMELGDPEESYYAYVIDEETGLKQLIGIVKANVHWWEPVADITTVDVDKNYTRNHIGETLMKNALENFKKRGVKKAELKVLYGKKTLLQ